MSFEIKQGDALEVLKTLPSESVHCCVTSPPYWGLRDYGVSGQLGLEKTPELYVSRMTEVFREVRRVLRTDGTLWLNIGDSYASPWACKRRSIIGNGSPDETVERGRMADGLKEKDLCGIPWLLAFALRSPYEHAVIRERIDRAWLAALIDGEGCMTIMRAENGKNTAESYPPVLQVKMCDPQCIEKANAITGFPQCLRQDSPSLGGVRDTYQWRITSRRAANVAAEIYPYLLIKRKQAIILWNHQTVRDGYETKRGVPMPTEAREKQKLCRELIQRLNQKQPVDLPSWMKEPELRIEPGWYLRQDLIWSKPNPMPESVTDRCTKAHEYLFLLSKSARYHYDQGAILEPVAFTSLSRLDQDVDMQLGSDRVPGKSNGNMKAVARTPASYKGSVPGRNGGPGQERRSAKDRGRDEAGLRPGSRFGREAGWRENTEQPLQRNKRSVWEVTTQPYSEAHFATFPPKLIEPCILAGCPEGGTVLDPFCGAGTTGLVATRLQRNALLIELNPAYCEMMRNRIVQDAPLFHAGAYALESGPAEGGEGTRSPDGRARESVEKK